MEAEGYIDLNNEYTDLNMAAPNMNFGFQFEFVYDDTIYVLEPKKDITAYELWNIYKLIEEIKLNSCYREIEEKIYKRIYGLEIERHFKRR